MVELVDAPDSKSGGSNTLRVRVSLRPPKCEIMSLRNLTINLIITIISILFALLLVELFLRFNGQGPWGSLDDNRNDPTLNKPSIKLGWIPKQGKYFFEPFSEEGEKFEINILPDGSRKVSFLKEKKPQMSKMIFLGGSVTLGWGVNDDQTFTSQLQKKIQNYEIKNFSVGGYGTYQAFLRLEEIIKNNDRVEIVILSYLPHHSIRNIGSEFWLRTLTKYSKRGYVSLPYASMNENNELIRKEPVTYLKLPLMDNLSIVNKVSKRIMQSKLKDNEKKAIPVTNLIFRDMRDYLKEKNIKLIVLNLSDSQDVLEPYIKTLKANNIDTINCNFRQTEKLTIKGDGHPNHILHAKYSNCINENLKKILN